MIKILSQKNITVRFLSTAYLLFQFSYALNAAENDFIAKQKYFINKLFTSGRYFDCIAETRRLICLNVSTEEKNSLNYFIESNYFLGGQYRTVISNLDKTSVSEDNFPSVLLKSQSYLKLENYSGAMETLNQVKYDQSGTRYRNDLFLRKIDLMLNVSKYEDIISEIETAEKYSVAVPEDMKTGISEYNNIIAKNKWLSVSMSAVVPGAGQVYSGKYIDGIISLISVAAASYGAYYFHNSGDRPLSMTSGFFAALFYCGNIYGAYNSAERASAEADRNFRMEFQRRYIPDYSPVIYFDFKRNL